MNNEIWQKVDYALIDRHRRSIIKELKGKLEGLAKHALRDCWIVIGNSPSICYAVFHLNLKLRVIYLLPTDNLVMPARLS